MIDENVEIDSDLLLHGAYVLWKLRETGPTTERELAHSLGVSSATHYSFYESTLASLYEGGLIDCDGEDLSEGAISVSKKWSRMQGVLGVSLADLARLGYRSALVATPIFGRANKIEETPELFVLMPFRAEMTPVYEDHIKKVGSNLGMSVARADDFYSSTMIAHDIWSAISSSEIIVADCTGRPPNVFYEIGLAHSLGKTVLLIAQDSQDIPFDIKHIRYLIYELTPRGMKSFEERLRRTLETELKGARVASAQKAMRPDGKLICYTALVRGSEEAQTNAFRLELAVQEKLRSGSTHNHKF